MEEAIRLNGVAVPANLAAFHWGRAAVVDPAGVRRALDGPDRRPAATSASTRARLADHAIPDVLRPAIERRVDDLVAYQSTGYARRYVGQVLSVLAAERAQAPSSELPVTAAFAQGLYKLMAYKDEYEVARLHLDSLERAKLSDQFGPGARVRIMLQPPILKKLGLRRKLSLGPATRPVFRLLHAARHLRGTPLDPFGHTHLRRTEQALVGEYLSLVGRALGHLEPASASAVVEVAELPDLVRGYEGIKLAAIDRFRTEGARRLLAVTDRRPSAVRSA
jgi:indolepyruvate ferredoxin oxidoreductase